MLPGFKWTNWSTYRSDIEHLSAPPSWETPPIGGVVLGARFRGTSLIKLAGGGEFGELRGVCYVDVSCIYGGGEFRHAFC